MSDDVDNFLAHYGIKGMRWGIRKEASDPPTKREIRNQAHYLSKGYSLEVAEKKARGRIAAQNVLMVAGGTVLAAGVGYAAYKTASRHLGGVKLPMGTPVHHVNVHGPNLKIGDKPMFVAFDKRDQKFYDSVFAQFSKNRSRAENIYKSTLKTTTDIKAPSNFRAKQLYKEFLKKMGETAGSPSYAEFNYNFNGEGKGSTRQKKAFAKFMQEKGYNAMIDNFDSVKSLRNRTNKPTILFDPTQSIKKVNDILLDNAKIESTALKYELSNLAGKLLVNPASIGVTAAVGLGTFGSNQAFYKQQSNRVDVYKRQNPGTTLSDAEIYNMVDPSLVN